MNWHNKKHSPHEDRRNATRSFTSNPRDEQGPNHARLPSTPTRAQHGSSPDSESQPTAALSPTRSIRLSSDSLSFPAATADHERSSSIDDSDSSPPVEGEPSMQVDDADDRGTTIIPTNDFADHTMVDGDTGQFQTTAATAGTTNTTSTVDQATDSQNVGSRAQSIRHDSRSRSRWLRGRYFNERPWNAFRPRDRCRDLRRKLGRFDRAIRPS